MKTQSPHKAGELTRNAIRVMKTQSPHKAGELARNAIRVMKTQSPHKAGELTQLCSQINGHDKIYFSKINNRLHEICVAIKLLFVF